MRKFKESEIPKHLKKYFKKVTDNPKFILRNTIIWCLSGGTYIYAKTQKGEMPMMIRDMARLKPETVKLWNGGKWTQDKVLWKKKPMTTDGFKC